MALTVWPLGGFPVINTALQRTAGTPTIGMNPASGSYTNGVYTQAGTQYVAALIDQQGINPTRVFFADNNTGGATTGGTVPLPTLVSITQVSAHGQSIQELPSTTFEVSDAVGYAGFLVVMTPAEPSPDSGGFSGAGQTQNKAGYFGGPTNQSTGDQTLIQAYGYVAGNPVLGYPQPQLRYYVSLNAILIVASTSTG
jgi:hypothetical protein